MSYNFLPYGRDQQFLLPPSLHEWVKEDSLERFISDMVDQLKEGGQLGAFYEGYRSDGWGRPAYHPVMLVKVLLYGYAVGVRSSRKIQGALERDVAFRYLAANQQPDFRTISAFRKANLEAFQALFVDVVELWREAGLVKLGRVAVDGRKVPGNAAPDQNRTRKRIEKEIRKILEDAEADRCRGGPQAWSGPAGRRVARGAPGSSGAAPEAEGGESPAGGPRAGPA